MRVVMRLEAEVSKIGCRNVCPDIQARLPEIEELQKQITASCEELADLDFKATEERAAAASREATLKVRAALSP